MKNKFEDENGIYRLCNYRLYFRIYIFLKIYEKLNICNLDRYKLNF